MKPLQPQKYYMERMAIALQDLKYRSGEPTMDLGMLNTRVSKSPWSWMIIQKNGKNEQFSDFWREADTKLGSCLSSKRNRIKKLMIKPAVNPELVAILTGCFSEFFNLIEDGATSASATSATPA